MEKTEMVLNKSRTLVMTKYVSEVLGEEQEVFITDGKNFGDMLKNRMYNHILYMAQKKKNSDGLFTCKISREEVCEKIIKNKTYQRREDIEQILQDLQHTSIIYWDKNNNKDVKVSYNLLVGYKYILQDDEWEIAIPEEIYNHLTFYLTDKKEKQRIEETLKKQRDTLSKEEIKKMEEQLEEKRKNYAPIDLYIMNTFKSNYTIKLYELLRLWSRTNKEITHKYSLEEIRYVLGVDENKYTRYSNFKQRILSVCLKELEEKANMIVKVQDIKTGKKTTDLLVSIFDKENKIYFREKKLNELKSMCLNISDENIRVEIKNEVLELEFRTQSYSQNVFEAKLYSLKKKISSEIEKAKEIEKYFEPSIFDKFKIEFKNLNLLDEDIKIQVLDSISKTLSNTENINGRIYAKNYGYLKTVLNKNYNSTDNKFKIPFKNIIEDCEDENINIPPIKEKLEKNYNKCNELLKDEENNILLERLKGVLEMKLEDITYKCWFAPLLEKAYIENDKVIFPDADEFAINIIKQRHIETLNEAILTCKIKSFEFIKCN